MEKKCRVLLTGGGGAIGAHIIAHLMRNTDWEIVVLDSFHHKGYRERITRICRDNPQWLERLTVIQHDLTCPISPSLTKQIGLVEHILHLAAMSDVQFSVDNPVFVVKNNVDSTLTMLEFARQFNDRYSGTLQSFVYFSTDETMGPVAKGEAHKEGDPHRPSNAYAASKAACEDLAYCWWRSYGLPVVVTNTMNNWSEMQSSSKFPAMVQQMIQRGEKVPIHADDKEIGTRYYIHSRNVADALLYILRNLSPYRHMQGRLDELDRYHIVGDTCYSNLELAQTIAKLMGTELEYELVDFHKDNPAHDIHYGMEDNRLRAHGWTQPVSTEDSLAKLIKWQQENPEWLT